jgi:hypothetical protein
MIEKAGGTPVVVDVYDSWPCPLLMAGNGTCL